jgi:REP element-mobilizing transposase RayT
MTTGYQITDQDAPYFLTLQLVDWVDLFTRQIYRDIMIDSLIHCQENKGLQIFGFVIMSNHMHIICNSSQGMLSDTIRDFKKYTSHKFIEELQSGVESRRDWLLDLFAFHGKRTSRNKNFQIWTHENHAILLYSNVFMWEKLIYLHSNPVRAGIVEKPEEYIYSSAKNYADQPGLLEIIRIARPLQTY